MNHQRVIHWRRDRHWEGPEVPASLKTLSSLLKRYQDNKLPAVVWKCPGCLPHAACATEGQENDDWQEPHGLMCEQCNELRDRGHCRAGMFCTKCHFCPLKMGQTRRRKDRKKAPLDASGPDDKVASVSSRCTPEDGQQDCAPSFAVDNSPQMAWMRDFTYDEFLQQLKDVDLKQSAGCRTSGNSFSAFLMKLDRFVF